MDELRQLLIENAALATELRLIKEQLLQANNANLYLLGRLVTDINGARETTSPSLKTLEAPSAGKHAERTAEAVPVEEVENCDLLNLDDDDHPNALSFGRPARSKPEASIGVGISNVSSPVTGTGEDKGFRVTQGDGSTTFVPTPHTETRTETPVFRRHPPDFHPSEHNRLLGAACFIEAMTDDEKASHWMRYAESFPRHVAEEYKEYYEGCIRREYLEKLEGRPRGEKQEVRDDKIDVAGTPEHLTGGEMPAGTVATGGPSFVTTTTGSTPPILTPMTKSSVSTVTRVNEPSSSSTRVVDSPGEAFRRRSPTASSHPTTATPIVPRAICRAPRDSYGSPSFMCHPRSVDDLRARGGEECRRTVVVSNIPPNIDLPEILAKAVRGNIVSVTHLRTAGMRTEPFLEMNGIMIVFMENSEAKAFVEDVNVNLIYFWCESRRSNVVARADLLSTPSRPIRHGAPLGFLPNPAWTKGSVASAETPCIAVQTSQNGGHQVDAAEGVRRDSHVQQGSERSSPSEDDDCVAEHVRKESEREEDTMLKMEG